jgi:Ca2+-binding EF-hand superfamily protein
MLLRSRRLRALVKDPAATEMQRHVRGTLARQHLLQRLLQEAGVEVGSDETEEIDADDDAMDELIQVVQLMEGKDEAELRQEFGDLDDDGSGKLDLAEVRTLVSRVFGAVVRESVVKACFDEMDEDGSGEVDFVEFAGFFGVGDVAEDDETGRDREPDAAPESAEARGEGPAALERAQFDRALMLPVQPSHDTWVEVEDQDSGHIYFWNPRTNETSWESSDEKRQVEQMTPRSRRIVERAEYYGSFLGQKEAVDRAEVEVAEELQQEDAERRTLAEGQAELAALPLPELVQYAAEVSIPEEIVGALLDGDDPQTAIAKLLVDAAVKPPEPPPPPKSATRFQAKKGRRLARALRNDLGEVLAKSGLDLEKAFVAFDADGDGGISMDEFRAGMRSLQLDLSEGQIDELIETIDQDGDGQLDYKEFVAQFEVNRAQNKASLLGSMMYEEEERLGYHDNDSDTGTEEDALGGDLADDEVLLVTNGGSAGAAASGTVGAGQVPSAATATDGYFGQLPPLSAFRAIKGLLPATLDEIPVPRLCIMLPSPAARPRPEEPRNLAQIATGGGFLDASGWRSDTFQLHLLCEWGCGHFIDQRCGYPVRKPRAVMQQLAPVLRPNISALADPAGPLTGGPADVLGRCAFQLPSRNMLLDMQQDLRRKPSLATPHAPRDTALEVDGATATDECEGCQTPKQVVFGIPAEGTRRWCEACAKRRTGAVDIRGTKCEGRQPEAEAIRSVLPPKMLAMPAAVLHETTTAAKMKIDLAGYSKLLLDRAADQGMPTPVDPRGLPLADTRERKIAETFGVERWLGPPLSTPPADHQTHGQSNNPDARQSGASTGYTSACMTLHDPTWPIALLT